MLVTYIDEHRATFGVEPSCEVLTEAGTKMAPSTYYAGTDQAALGPVRPGRVTGSRGARFIG